MPGSSSFPLFLSLTYSPTLILCLVFFYTSLFIPFSLLRVPSPHSSSFISFSFSLRPHAFLILNMFCFYPSSTNFTTSSLAHPVPFLSLSSEEPDLDSEKREKKNEIRLLVETYVIASPH